jgi:hypothetical protein
VEIVSHGECHLCGEPSAFSTDDNQGKPVLRHHCIYEIDRLMTSDLVKTDVQFDVIPFFFVTKAISFFPGETKIKTTPCQTSPDRRYTIDLATLYCQILS